MQRAQWEQWEQREDAACLLMEDRRQTVTDNTEMHPTSTVGAAMRAGPMSDRVVNPVAPRPKPASTSDVK